ncbi:MAG TPA: rRNA adenine N(6)-methyltransferase family protein [Candidatus Udaeobacter sp.]|nr:rRNA adenine N(6)-methyltransferase family protein [Candidatus Udaeobacter sp.]
MSPRTRSQLWRTQNAISEPSLAAKLVSLSQVGPRDVVYDLGAGSGVLTAALARQSSRVIAIERDPALVRRLRRRFHDVPNVIVREGDILACRLPRSEYVIVANPPFDITADLVRKLVDAETPPRDGYLVLQREAAQRFAGRPRMTLAALLLAPWFSLQVLHTFHRSDFAPAPGVDAVFVRLHKRGPPLVARSEGRLYRDFVTVAFSAWRPTIAAALAATLGRAAADRLLAHAAVDRHLPPSHLELGGWLALFREFRSAPLVIRQRVAGAEAHARRQRARLRKLHRTRTPRDSLDRRLFGRDGLIRNIRSGSDGAEMRGGIVEKRTHVIGGVGLVARA